MEGTFGKVKGWVENHPWMTAAIVFFLGLLIIYWWNSGSSSSSSAPADTSGLYGAIAASNQANDQLQAAQLAAQTQLSGLKLQTDSALSLAQAQIGGQVQVARLQYASQDAATQAGVDIATIQAGTSKLQIAATQEAADTAANDALSAQLKGFQTTLDVANVNADVAKTQSAASVTIAGLTTNAAVKEAQIASDTALGQAKYAFEATNANDAAAVSIAGLTADAQKAQYASQQAIAEAAASASAQIAASQASATVGVASYQAQATEAVASAQLSAIEDTNKLQFNLANLAAGEAWNELQSLEAFVGGNPGATSDITTMFGHFQLSSPNNTAIQIQANAATQQNLDVQNQIYHTAVDTANIWANENLAQYGRH